MTFANVQGFGDPLPVYKQTSYRPTWPEVMINVAATMAMRSTCPRASAGAVIVTVDNQILTTGYNGAAGGQPHCSLVGCLIHAGHCVRAIHAEANALMQAAKLGIAVNGAVMYCTYRPCIYCIKLILQAGIQRVCYVHDYHTDELLDTVMEMAKAGGVQFVQFDD